MTIKGLQKLAAKHPGQITIINQLSEGEITRQWIGVYGLGIYPADGLPTLDEETILCMLDVPRNKWSDWNVRTTTRYGLYEDMLEDNADQDEPLAEMALRLIDDNREYKFLRAASGALAIWPEYLLPIGLTSQHDYWLRTIHRYADAKPIRIVVVKLGMELVGVVGLTDEWAMAERNMDELRQIAAQAEKLVTMGGQPE